MRTRLTVLLGLLATAAMLAAAIPALAGSPTPTISPGGTRFREGHPMNRILQREDPPSVHGDPPPGPRHDGRHRRGGGPFKRFRGHDVIVLPSPAVVVRGPCWTPGYWAYQWVSQVSPYHVWVPGYWSVAGTWVPGHYQTHYYSAGAYQPYWVEGYWSAC